MQQNLRKETPIYFIFCLFNPAVYTRVPTRSIFLEIFIFSCLEAVFRSNFWGCYTSNSISISISKCFKAWNELESCVASVKTMKMMTMRNLRWPHMKTPRLPRTFGPRLLWPLARAPWHKNLTPRTSSETWDNVRLRISSSSLLRCLTSNIFIAIVQQNIFSGRTRNKTTSALILVFLRFWPILRIVWGNVYQDTQDVISWM